MRKIPLFLTFLTLSWVYLSASCTGSLEDSSVRSNDVSGGRTVIGGNSGGSQGSGGNLEYGDSSADVGVTPGNGASGGSSGLGGRSGSNQGGAISQGGAPGLDSASLGGATPSSGGKGGNTLVPSQGARQPCTPPSGYRNLFSEILGKTPAEVDAKVEKVVQQYFHGSSDEVIYYEVGSDQAQIRDIASNDVRSEGQSYGMLITVSMGMKVEFDKLWNYASKCMQQPSGTFGWQYRHGACSAMSTGSAPDGEEYFAMALTLASRRWGDGTGVNYAAEAKKVMNTMIKVNFFNKDPAVVRFVVGSPEADPSYVLPLFYSEWACLDTDNTSFWKKATTDAYTFFHKATNASTGLNPYRSNFNGVPSPGNLGIFQSDPWRVPMNIMMDYNLNKTDAKWQEQYAQTHAAFWVKEGLTSYGNQYALDGTKLQGNHGPGLDAVNAMLAFALPPGDSNAKALLERAWTVTPQTGNQRYYAGCLYMLSFIHMSGKFQLFY